VRVRTEDQPALPSARRQLCRPPALREELETRRKLYGHVHISVVKSLKNLAVLYCRVGDLDASASLLRQTVEVREALVGHEHPDVAYDTRLLGDVLRFMGRSCRNRRGRSDYIRR
jgi:hypothetical protein